MKNYLILSILILVLGTFSCEQEESNSRYSVDNNILVFNDYNEFKSSLQKVVEMEDIEFKNYEKTNNYNSFGRLSEEFYKGIDFESFRSREDLMIFVEENDKYLTFIEDDEGELELETRFYNRADRYFLNEEGIYIIGDIAYKAIESGTLMAKTSEIDVLREIGFRENINDKDLSFKPNSKSSRARLKSSNCGTSHSWRSTDGSDRLKVEIGLDTHGYDEMCDMECSFLARPYKKILGVWYWCSRSTKVDVELNYEYQWSMTGIPGESLIWSTSLVYLKGYINEYKLEKVDRFMAPYAEDYDNYYFTSYDVWADTYDVSPISTSCN